MRYVRFSDGNLVKCRHSHEFTHFVFGTRSAHPVCGDRVALFRLFIACGLFLTKRLSPNPSPDILWKTSFHEKLSVIAKHLLGGQLYIQLSVTVPGFKFTCMERLGAPKTVGLGRTKRIPSG